MSYIDLNMVRAGVVAHPYEWEWCGYSELLGSRQRYRLLSTPEVATAYGAPSLEAFRVRYTAAIKECLIQGRTGVAMDRKHCCGKRRVCPRG